MKKLLWVAVLMLASWAAQATDPYRYVINLTEVKDDKVKVELLAPKIKEKEIIFYLPKIIPGTYSIADYGRFVSEFKAYDKRGKELEVEKLDDNSWKITKAKKLEKISYWVEDSFDTTSEGPEIFEPAGTNIEDNKNFVINPCGFFGYFEGMKETPFEVNVIRNKDFYGSTGLIPEQSGGQLGAKLVKEEMGISSDDFSVDQFLVEDYDRLVDSPLMYSKADTAIIKVANTDVLIASYSPTQKVTAKEIAASIQEVLMAQKEFLGGKLPVEKYAFIFYFTDQPVQSYGALEHSYSSFYFIPEAPIQRLQQTIRDFAAHEFFHIVTPLTIHSEEIENFDFNDPKMSKHLWLYEGMTEYFAGSVQVKYEIISREDYLGELRQKIATSKRFKDTLPFTELSKKTLDEHADQYYNVYMKGALIGMALDITLLELSDGKYGAQELVANLSAKYGKNKAFNDEELFGAITAMTYPEVGEFFAKYVEGEEALPYEELFKKVGISYEASRKTMELSFGISDRDIKLGEYNGTRKLAIASGENLNEMGKALGLKTDDILLAFDGKEIPELGPQLMAYFQEVEEGMEEGKTFTVKVARATEDGSTEEVELSAEAIKIPAEEIHVIEFMESPSEEQLTLREAWLKPRK